MTKEQKNCKHKFLCDSPDTQDLTPVGEFLIIRVTCIKCDLEMEAQFKFDRFLSGKNREIIEGEFE
jgi:hypothetical protein